MKMAKVLVTVVLLAFVLVAMGYLVWDSIRKGSATVTPADTAAMVEETPAETAAASAEAAPPHKVIAYYFHGAKRCNTCRRIEAYTEEAIRLAYRDEMGDGRLEWRVVNMEEEGNEHFVQDYELAMSAVVISDVRDGKQERWKNLERIWHLTFDKEAFIAYIQDETGAYLAGDHG
jgi:hypothetical protein